MPRAVLLAGATGTLGHHIAVHLGREPDTTIRLLVRPGASQDPATKATLQEPS